jgi:hypothetical protein
MSLKNSSYWRLLSASLSDGSCRSGVNHPGSSGSSPSSSRLLRRQRFSPGSPLHTKLPQHSGRSPPHRSPLSRHGSGGGGGPGGGGDGGEHAPVVSNSCSIRWRSAAFGPTHSVCSFEGLPGGLWQISTFGERHGGCASAREGTSAPRTAAAKIFSARRRLMLPLARLRASSSKLWLCLSPCPGSSDIGYHLSFFVTSPMYFEQHIQFWSMVRFCPWSRRFTPLVSSRSVAPFPDEIPP